MPRSRDDPGRLRQPRPSDELRRGSRGIHAPARRRVGAARRRVAWSRRAALLSPALEPARSVRVRRRLRRLRRSAALAPVATCRLRTLAQHVPTQHLAPARRSEAKAAHGPRPELPLQKSGAWSLARRSLDAAGDRTQRSAGIDQSLRRRRREASPALERRAGHDLQRSDGPQPDAAERRHRACREALFLPRQSDGTVQECRLHRRAGARLAGAHVRPRRSGVGALQALAR